MAALTLETTKWYRIILQWYNIAFIYATMSQESSVVLTLTAVTYIWHDPVFEESLSEDQGFGGAVVCSAEGYTSTDEEDCHWNSWTSRCDRNTWNSV